MWMFNILAQILCIANFICLFVNAPGLIYWVILGIIACFDIVSISFCISIEKDLKKKEKNYEEI